MSATLTPTQDAELGPEPTPAQIQQIKRIILNVYAPPRIITFPSRFHYEHQPKSQLDGHRHEYGLKSLVCENPKVKRCGIRAPIEIVRMDKQRAWYEQVQSQMNARMEAMFWDEEDSRDGLLYLSAQQAREGSIAS